MFRTSPPIRGLSVFVDPLSRTHGFDTICNNSSPLLVDTVRFYPLHIANDLKTRILRISLSVINVFVSFFN